jgi:hypothetical protein
LPYLKCTLQWLETSKPVSRWSKSATNTLARSATDVVSC